MLLDWRLQGSPIAELVAMLYSAAESLKVIVLISRPELRAAAQQAGARGYLLKGASKKEIIWAIRDAASGAAIF